MEADRPIRSTDINDWMKALRGAEIESGDWSDLHVQGARLTLQTMAASEDPYTGADLQQVFASLDVREALKDSVSADVHTFTAIDPKIWQELSQRAATLTDVSSD